MSENGGTTFARRASGLPSVRGSALQTAPDGALWLTAEGNGLYRSPDKGITFAKVNGVGEAGLLGFGASAAGRREPAVYLAGTVGGVEGMFRSDDSSATWTRIDDDRHRFGGLRALTGDPRVWGRVYVATSGRGILYGDTP